MSLQFSELSQLWLFPHFIYGRERQEDHLYHRARLVIFDNTIHTRTARAFFKKRLTEIQRGNEETEYQRNERTSRARSLSAEYRCKVPESSLLPSDDHATQGTSEDVVFQLRLS